MEDYIYFGSYPQTKLIDELLIEKLSKFAGNTLTLIIDDNTEYATDVEYNGSKYRGVHLNKNTYWFKYEPIKWNILSRQNTSALLISDMLLDLKRFDKESNNFEKTEICKWLNGEFSNTAFSIAEQDKIENILLPSYDIVINENYGFMNGTGADNARIKYVTDYAKAMGAETELNAGYWWLCSTHKPDEHGLQCVLCDGSIGLTVNDSELSVAPTLLLTL